eukprot:m.1277006 g.1277006  ORF g.1277006 m.1277006 type:complete len:465 (-) comp24764_c0_seq7:1909-3303(-)
MEPRGHRVDACGWHGDDDTMRHIVGPARQHAGGHGLGQPTRDDGRRRQVVGGGQHRACVLGARRHCKGRYPEVHSVGLRQQNLGEANRVFLGNDPRHAVLRLLWQRCGCIRYIRGLCTPLAGRMIGALVEECGRHAQRCGLLRGNFHLATALDSKASVSPQRYPIAPAVHRVSREEHVSTLQRCGGQGPRMRAPGEHRIGRPHQRRPHVDGAHSPQRHGHDVTDIVVREPSTRTHQRLQAGVGGTRCPRQKQQPQARHVKLVTGSASQCVAQHGHCRSARPPLDRKQRYRCLWGLRTTLYNTSLVWCRSRAVRRGRRATPMVPVPRRRLHVAGQGCVRRRCGTPSISARTRVGRLYTDQQVFHTACCGCLVGIGTIRAVFAALRGHGVYYQPQWRLAEGGLEVHVGSGRFARAFAVDVKDNVQDSLVVLGSHVQTRERARHAHSRAVGGTNVQKPRDQVGKACA